MQQNNKIEISNFLLQDLNIIEDIIPKINFTITKYGYETLKNQLKYIEYDNLEINIFTILYLHNNKEYTKTIENELFKIYKNQHIIDIWFSDNCDSDIYFDKQIDFLNNSYILSIYNNLKIGNIILTILTFIILYYVCNMCGYDINPIEYFNSLIITYHTMATSILNYVLSDSDTINIIASACMCIYICVQLPKIYNIINLFINHQKKCDIIKQEYNIIFETLQTIKTIIEIDHLNYNIKNISNSEKIKLAYHNVIKHFDTNNSLGIIITEKLNCNMYKEDFNYLCEYIGWIDMMISNSILLDNGYCVPNIDLISEKPYIMINNVWNPIMNYQTQIKNDINIGEINDKTNKTLIITGPHKAGKTTFMKSCILAIYLAQSIGVSCCKELIFTPFKSIVSYLNIPNNYGKQSLFEAELDRCLIYYNNCKQANNKNFIIGFIDELFCGSNNTDCIAGSYAVIKNLSNAVYALTVIITHFNDICCIENVDYKQFKAIENISKTNIKKYKIYDGISKQCMAINLLKSCGYSNDVIMSAKDKIKEIKKD